MRGLIPTVKLFCKRNASTILTCLGAAGVVATTVVAVKDTPKALELLKEAKEEKGEDLTKLEAVKVAGPVYIPTVLMSASTITCIFGANVLNKRHQAALMSAYALLDTSYKEYKDKVTEILGEETHKMVQKEVAKDRFEVIDVAPDKELFFDSYALRYFESTMDEVLRAENMLNQQLVENGYASLNDFYDLLGAPQVDYGYELGWSLHAGNVWYGYSRVKFEHDDMELADGLMAHTLSIETEPTPDYLN